MLELQDVVTRYGNIEALRGVSVSVEQGQIVTIIGANGAGKSTLLMTVCGSPKPSAGQVLFEGHDISGLATYDIVKLGISQAPEGRRIFPRMTVLENLQMGTVPTDGQYFEEDVERVFALFPRLKERLGQRGGTLSGGEQQMLCIGRALMARPRMLLLDEPSLGIAPDPRAPDLRGDRRHQQAAGPDDPPGRAERLSGAQDSPPRLRAADRPRRDGGHGRRAPGQPGDPCRLSRRRPLGSRPMQAIIGPSLPIFIGLTDHPDRRCRDADRPGDG